jgi:hypothetical protein
MLALQAASMDGYLTNVYEACFFPKRDWLGKIQSLEAVKRITADYN